MSATALLWIAILVATTVMSVTRPAWALALYMATFFAAPQNWWWGDEVPSFRYALAAGVVLIISVFINRPDQRSGHKFTFVHVAALLMIVNASFVHFFLASKPSISIGNYVEILKYVLLIFLMWQAVRTKDDLRLVLMAIALGAGYIGYEVTINERGYFAGGRLEGVGAPGADSANSLACLLLTTLPMTSSLLVNSRLYHKAVVAFSAPLALNVILLCNSRGAFLGLIGAGLAIPAHRSRRHPQTRPADDGTWRRRAVLPAGGPADPRSLLQHVRRLRGPGPVSRQPPGVLAGRPGDAPGLPARGWRRAPSNTSRGASI